MDERYAYVGFAGDAHSHAPVTDLGSRGKGRGRVGLLQEISVDQAATTIIRAARRDRGFRFMTISTSRSRAVSIVISRSTENPASL